MKGELHIARHVIVEAQGDAPPHVLCHTLAPTEDEAWHRCWLAGHRTNFNTPGAARAVLEGRGFACRRAVLRVELGP